MAESVREDEIWMRMVRIDGECWGVVVAEPWGPGEEEDVLTSMELETIVVLNRS